MTVGSTVVEYERLLSHTFDSEICGGWFRVPGSVGLKRPERIDLFRLRASFIVMAVFG
jgi:hypothetical protein